MSNENNIPNSLLYTKEHEWLRVEEDSDIVTIGITDFAQENLGDIVYVEVDSDVGDTVEKDDIFGTIEAVKTVSDLFMPITGEIVEKNDSVEDEPSLVNESVYDEGWIIKIKVSDKDDLDSLLKASEYETEIFG